MNIAAYVCYYFELINNAVHIIFIIKLFFDVLPLYLSVTSVSFLCNKLGDYNTTDDSANDLNVIA